MGDPYLVAIVDFAALTAKDTYRRDRELHSLDKA
jgi:hypothetical protein